MTMLYKMFKPEAISLLHFCPLVPPNGWLIKEKNSKLKIHAALLLQPFQHHPDTAQHEQTLWIHSKTKKTSTHRRSSCNYFNLHRYTHRLTETQRITCIMILRLPVVVRKNDVDTIVDIKWILAGCCGCEVLFSHEAARHTIKHAHDKITGSYTLVSYFIHKWGVLKVSASCHGLLAIHKLFCNL